MTLDAATFIGADGAGGDPDFVGSEGGHFDRRGGAGRVVFEVASDGAFAFGDAQGSIALKVDGALDKYEIWKLQDAKEEPACGEILWPGSVGDAAVDDDEARSGLDGFEIEVGPDLGFKDEQQGGTNDGESAANAGTVVERGVEETIDKRDSLTLSGFAACDC